MRRSPRTRDPGGSRRPSKGTEHLPTGGKDDLAQQMPVREEVVGIYDPEVPITPLRAIDIVGWEMGRVPR